MPAALVAARVHIADGSPRKASKAIRATWRLSPHPDLARLLGHLKPGDGPEARFERVRDLVKDHPGGLEGAYALARAAVAAQRWDVARKALEPHLAERPQARLCALMADIEEAQGDRGRAREWLARAVTAQARSNLGLGRCRKPALDAGLAGLRRHRALRMEGPLRHAGRGAACGNSGPHRTCHRHCVTATD